MPNQNFRDCFKKTTMKIGAKITLFHIRYHIVLLFLWECVELNRWAKKYNSNYSKGKKMSVS